MLTIPEFSKVELFVSLAIHIKMHKEPLVDTISLLIAVQSQFLKLARLFVGNIHK
ncbi:hypothetical protein MED297_07033 [Reinekea sp. MED297]|uniref:Uncharacterized protein n=1 Tax=Reinekea blandensis MED297 TaxID=314283 RepID=A4BFA3_9GAMM|nr:hypothetical protein MED297_07033 [Reinekea sp. MED297] [Reinekea blandensis MED297]